MPASDEDAARPDERHSGAQKVYFLCFTDPVSMSPDEMRPFIEEHKTWLTTVEASGMLFLGGPLLDETFNFSGSGLMVLRATSIAEARVLMDADPFHANGIRRYRLVPWQVNEGTISLHVTLSSGEFALD